VSTTIIAAQKGQTTEIVFDVIDINGANLTGQAASIVKALRDPDGAAAETVTITEQGSSGFYKWSFNPTKGGMPPKNYYLRLDEPVGSAERVHQWQIQSYTALPSIAGPVANLTTLAHVKESLKIPTATTGDDAFLENSIARMSEWIRARIRPLVIIQETFTERHTGDGSSFVWLDCRPVLSVASVHESLEWTFNAGSLLASSEYDVGVASILRKNVGFYSWPRAIQVVYTAGYAAVPLEIEQLAIDAVSWKYQMRTSTSGIGGVSSRTLKDGSVTYSNAQGGAALPSAIEDELGRIRQQSIRGAA
jgi:hypothetical protein